MSRLSNPGSPNDALWQPWYRTAGRFTTGAVAATDYMVVTGAADSPLGVLSNAGYGGGLGFDFLASEVGPNFRMRLRALVLAGTTAPGVTLTVCLKSITVPANSVVLSAAAPGSSVNVGPVAVSGPSRGVSGEFTLPNDGIWVVSYRFDATTLSGCPILAVVDGRFA